MVLELTGCLEINKKMSNQESFTSDAAAAASLLLNYTTDRAFDLDQEQAEDIQREGAALTMDIQGVSGESNTTGTSSTMLFHDGDQEERVDVEAAAEDSNKCSN